MDANWESTIHPIRWFLVLLLGLCFGMGLAAACGRRLGVQGPCDGLVYKEYGLDREEYVPCAGEMVATMDRMRPLLEAALAGDRAARSEAQGLLRDLSELMEKAGGRNTLERWQDTSLNDLNLHIWNAYNHYQTFLMLPILSPNAPGSNDVRGALEDEYRNGNRSHDSAKYMYEGMRR